MPGKTRLLIVLPYSSLAEAQAGPRAAERLVRGRGDEVGDRHRVVVQPGGDEAGVVGHVDHQLRADFAGDLGELVVRNLARIGARAGDDQLRLVLAGQPGDLVEVEAVRVARHAVADEVVQHAGDVQLHAVREVAAVGQVEAQHRVARLERREIDRRVGLRAAVRLHVGELGAEQLLRAVDGQLLDDVDELAAAVVAPARIAFGILIREHAAGGLHHGGAGVVFAGDHLQAVCWRSISSAIAAQTSGSFFSMKFVTDRHCSSGDECQAASGRVGCSSVQIDFAIVQMRRRECQRRACTRLAQPRS